MGLQFPVEQITIRPALETDADWGASLLFESGPGLFSYLFALTPDKAKDVLHQAFAAPNHAFSYEYAQILEVAVAPGAVGDPRPVGLVLGYPGSIKRRAEENVHGIMAHILPLTRVPRILVNLADLSRIKQDVLPQDYYILSLCIDPEFRNQGLGTALLQDTEILATEQGCPTLCMDVAYTNVGALGLLGRLGYGITCSKTSHRFEQMTDAGGLHRLEKRLV
jgi:ribosomal protein S18 acetylase RimI-like enzyme